MTLPERIAELGTNIIVAGVLAIAHWVVAIRLDAMFELEDFPSDPYGQVKE